MRLAIVWRSRDIFSVVPRNVLGAAAGAAGCRRCSRLGRSLWRWGRGRLLGGLGLLLRGLSGGQYVLLADPSTDPGPVERCEVDAVLLGEFADQRCHVTGVRVARYQRWGSRSRGRRTVLLRSGIFFCSRCRDLGLLLRPWSGLRPRCWLGLRLWSWLGGWLRLRRRRCRGSGLPDDRKNRSNFNRLVFLDAYLQQCPGSR